MAVAGVKLDSESSGFVSNCFPVRGLLKRDANEGDGAWYVAHRAEQRRRFKAVLCAKPRTYSRIREERKRAEDHGVRLTAGQFEEEEEEQPDTPVLDGYFLMKHCCVEDPADLCSINIAGLELTDVKEEDFEMFDNVAYVNAGENYLPFEAFRGFPSLRELELPFNGLRSLKITVGNFPQLEVLDLSYNNLSQEDVLTIGELSTLRVLHLTGNNFRHLPPDMSLPFRLPGRKVHRPRFPKLEVLLLDDNKLGDINVFAVLAGLPKLRHINMEKNEIFCIPQLKCVEGRVVTQDGSKSKRPHSGRKSSRRSKSRQSGLPSAPDQSSEKTLEGQSRTEAAPPTADTTNEQPGADTTDGKGKEKDELNIDELMKDDFSLGDLTDRIEELEEETAKVMDMDKSGAEDYVPRALPPFPELRYLNLAHNQIREEDAVLAVAAWPMLVQLVIHSNPLTTQHPGDPPLLKRFLSDRLGIRLQRKEEPRLVKPHIEVQPTKSRTVNDTVPKVPRSTIEERLQQLALEAPPKPPPALEPQRTKSWLLEDRTLSGLDLETSKRMPLPPIPPTPPSAPTTTTQAWVGREEEEDVGRRKEEEEGAVGGAAAGPESDAFFMTQVDEPGEDRSSKQQKQPSRDKTTKTQQKNDAEAKDPGRYRGYELLLEEDPDVEMEVELPKDIQGNVRALKHALGHTLVYRDASVDLDRVKRTVTEYRRAPVPPAKPHKPRQERVDDLLANQRSRNTVDEETLVTVLKDKGQITKKFPNAQQLLAQIQRKYNSVRIAKQEEFDSQQGYKHCEHYTFDRPPRPFINYYQPSSARKKKHSKQKQ